MRTNLQQSISEDDFKMISPMLAVLSQLMPLHQQFLAGGAFFGVFERNDVTEQITECSF